jgi:DNA-binding XRE family transcriptional regulator
MARKFKELSDALDAKLTPQQRAQSKARYAQMLEQVRLSELRRHCKLTQVELAKTIGVDQGAISRIENQSDMSLRTLSNYIEGTGGRLEIRAVYPNESLTIDVVE